MDSYIANLSTAALILEIPRGFLDFVLILLAALKFS